MELIDKARIITDFVEVHGGDPQWSDFMQYNDLGIPYSIGLSSGHILSMSDIAEQFVSDTWSDLCVALGLDSSNEFDSVDDFFVRAQ